MTKQDAATGSEEAGDPTQENDLFLVGIGASAGGLEALEGFFTHCGCDTGAAYVVVQHLSPDHKSMMLDLLSRYTRMEVLMVEDGMAVEPDKVYLIPAGTIMRITHQGFELTPKQPHTLTLPIDIFFTSMAETYGSRAVGIVLSGTGSDGTRGAMAINAAGGFLLAQEAKSAKFDGMPSSMIGTGLVDAILPVDQLPERVLSHITNAPPQGLVDLPEYESVPLSEEDAFEGVLHLMMQASGIDFHEYKVATVLRRIERRMQIRHLGKVSSYFELLKAEREELVTLKRDLLIPVTNFFRDPVAFDALNQLVVDDLVKRAEGGGPIRVWSAGVSTGEEAYSLAMLFIEAFERMRRWPSIKIFATDVSQENIDQASAGVFSASIASEVPAERLERFFNAVGDGYEVKPELRQMIVFARHNLLADPPFTQMDLVTCRNTLIYFTQDAQRKALLRLQFATKAEGYLFLGSSEAIPGGEFGFTSVKQKEKIFRRTSQASFFTFDDERTAFSGYKSQVINRRSKVASKNQSDLESIDRATRALIEQFAPPSVLISNQTEIVHLFGRVQRYFQFRDGSASLQINRVLPDKVVPVASALMYKAAKDNTRLVSDVIHLKDTEGQPMTLRLSVSVVQKREEEVLLLLSFEEQMTEDVPHSSSIDVNQETMDRVNILESELIATRESLQATIEELETSNEELQATNEELMAANEELQSSNEELQSVNEELNTVNAEFQEKVLILNRLNADLDSMTKAVGVPTVFVDNELNVTRFSPDAQDIFKLRENDVGRPLDEIKNDLAYDGLMLDFEEVVRKRTMIQKELSTNDDRLLLMRMLPCSISTDRSGVVATFVDMTAFRDRQRLQIILDGLPEHIAVLKNDGTIAMVNRAWTRFAKANGDPDMSQSGPGANYLAVCMASNGEPDSDASKAYLGIKAVLEGSQPGFSLQYPCHSPTEDRWFVMNVAPIQSEEFCAVVSHINITSWYNKV